MNKFSFNARQARLTPETGDYILGTNPAGRPRWEGNAHFLTRDGAPVLPIMGEFHFSRYPAEDWRDELLKMKMGGIQIVATYVFWIHHEEIQGEYDWGGQRNLRHFVELCAELDLLVWLRIGPWSHGECRNGGFPDWIRTAMDMPADAVLGWASHGQRSTDPRFLTLVERLYREIFEQVSGLFYPQGGPILGVQLENEYAAQGEGQGEAYLLRLLEMAMQIGFTPIYWTITGWSGVGAPLDSVIPVFGDYPAAPWEPGANELGPSESFAFHLSEPNERGISRPRKFADNGIKGAYPYLTAELGVGVQVTDRRRPRIQFEDGMAEVICELGEGANLLGYYMYHGGSNPKGKRSTLQESKETLYPTDCPVCSYDFQAPVREYGQLNESYHGLRRLHYFCRAFGAPLARMVPILPNRRPKDKGDLKMPRMVLRSNGARGFLFINNHVRGQELPAWKGVSTEITFEDEGLKLTDGGFTIPADASCIFPLNLPLGPGKILSATAQLITRGTINGLSTDIFFAVPGIAPVIQLDAEAVATVLSESGKVELDGDRFWIEGMEPGIDCWIEVVMKTGECCSILVLDEETSRQFYHIQVDQQDGFLFTDGELLLEGDRWRLLSQNDSIALCTYGIGRVELDNGGGAEPGVDGRYLRYHFATPAAGNPSVSVIEQGDACWVLQFAEVDLSTAREVFVTIPYQAGKARLFIGDELIADNFFNGEAFEIGLRRWTDLLSVWNWQMRLELEAFEPNADVYLDVERPIGAQLGVIGLSTQREISGVLVMSVESEAA